MSSRALKEVAAVAVVLAVLLGGYLLVHSTGGGDTGTPARPIPSVHGVGFDRQTIYHSPQTPGYTAWVGAWTMPDGSLETGFVQATGPVAPADRTPAPAAVLRAFGRAAPDPDRDFWGLRQEVVTLRSSDGGTAWTRARTDRFRAVAPYAYTQQPTIALTDGTILRRVNGDDLRQDDRVPHTAYLQRLDPGATSWGQPEVLLDPAKYTYQITRLRKLDDGRLIATGNLWRVPAEAPADQRTLDTSSYLLMVSDDDGLTWRNGLTIPKGVGYLPGNEWDTAELPNGDLVALMRTLDGPTTRKRIRKQAILRKDGDGWIMTEVRVAPFPPSGHPELLRTREGPILSIATTGTSYTKDGIHWTTLDFPGGKPYASDYYPRALQTSDGVIHVFGHTGSDDPYGTVDQSITMASFRLARDVPPGTDPGASGDGG